MAMYEALYTGTHKRSPYNPVILLIQHFVVHKIFISISINVHGDSVDLGGTGLLEFSLNIKVVLFFF